jgi:hypothetical protein
VGQGSFRIADHPETIRDVISTFRALCGQVAKSDVAKGVLYATQFCRCGVGERRHFAAAGVKTSVEGCKISSCLLLPIEKQLFPSAV